MPGDEDDASDPAEEIPADWMASIVMLSQQVEDIAARIGNYAESKPEPEPSTFSAPRAAHRVAESPAADPVAESRAESAGAASPVAPVEACIAPLAAASSVDARSQGASPPAAPPAAHAATAAVNPSPPALSSQLRAPPPEPAPFSVRSQLERTPVVVPRASGASPGSKLQAGRSGWAASRTTDRFAFNSKGWEASLAGTEHRRASMTPPPPAALVGDKASILELDASISSALDQRIKQFVVFESGAPPLAASASFARRGSGDGATPSRRGSVQPATATPSRRGSVEPAAASSYSGSVEWGSSAATPRRGSVAGVAASAASPRRSSFSPALALGDGRPPPPGVPHAASSIVTGAGLSAALLRVPALFTVHARDVNGAPCGLAPDAAYKFSFRGPEVPVHSISELVESGRVVLQWVPTVSGEYEVSVTLRGEHLPGSPFAACAAHGAIAPALSEVRGAPSRVRAGANAGFDLVARDQAGNLADYSPLKSSHYAFRVWVDGPAEASIRCVDRQDGVQTVTLGLTVAGRYQVHVRCVDGVEPLVGSPFGIECVAAELDAARCDVGGEALAGAVAGVPAPFWIRPVDAFGNPCGVSEPQLGAFDVQLTPTDAGASGAPSAQPSASPRNRGGGGRRGGKSALALAGLDGSTCGRVYLGDGGVLQGEFTATTAGPFTLWVRFSDKPLRGSPFALRVSPAPTHTSSCLRLFAPAHGRLDDAVAGAASSFQIVARDQFGNVRRQGGDVFESSLIGPAAAPATVADMADGAYSVQYAPTVAGEYLLSLTRDGQHIQGSPFGLRVWPAATHADQCVVYGRGTAAGDAGYRQVFEIGARDAHGNPRGVGGDLFAAVLTGPEGKFDKIPPAHCEVMDKGDGIYEVSYTLAVCGAFRLQVWAASFAAALSTPLHTYTGAVCGVFSLQVRDASLFPRPPPRARSTGGEGSAREDHTACPRRNQAWCQNKEGRRGESVGTPLPPPPCK